MLIPRFGHAVGGIALYALTSLATAAVLYAQPPVPGINGIQSDASTGAYEQTFVVTTGSTLESIEWYGYHLLVGEIAPGIVVGPDFDDFTIEVNGLAVSGAFSKSVVLSAAGTDLYHYLLDVADAPISSGSITIANGAFTQWAWQFGAPLGAAADTAFTLNGVAAPAPVPEPTTAALMLLAVAGCAATRRRRPG